MTSLLASNDKWMVLLYYFYVFIYMEGLSVITLTWSYFCDSPKL